MLTKDDALTANEFHYGECKRTFGTRGGVTITREVWRRNGQTKVWKTRPTEYRIPVKHGIYAYGSIDQYDAPNVHTRADCPLNR